MSFFLSSLYVCVCVFKWLYARAWQWDVVVVVSVVRDICKRVNGCTNTTINSVQLLEYLPVWLDILMICQLRERDKAKKLKVLTNYNHKNNYNDEDDYPLPFSPNVLHTCFRDTPCQHLKRISHTIAISLVYIVVFVVALQANCFCFAFKIRNNITFSVNSDQGKLIFGKQ